MAARTEELKIVINGDASGANKTFSNLTAKMKSMGPQLAAIGGKLAIGIGLAFAAGAAAVGSVVKKSFDAWLDNSLIQTKLNNTIRNTGKISGVTAEMINDLAGEIQRLTRFEDDSVVAAGEVLARYKNIAKDVFPEALKLTADLAERFGVDMPSAAAMFAKALSSPGEGLKVLMQAGLDIDEKVLKKIERLSSSGKVKEAQELIMSLLSGTVGGEAQAAGKTGSGMIDQFKNSFGGIFDTLGESMGPGFEKIISFALTSLNQLTSDPAFINFMRVLGEEFNKFADQLPRLVGDIRRFMEEIGLGPAEIINGLATGFRILGMSLTIGIELFRQFAALIGPAKETLSMGITAGVQLAQIAFILFNNALSGAKQTLSDLNFILDNLALYLNVKITEAFKKVMESKFMKSARAIFDGISFAINTTIDAIAALVDWLGKLAKAKLGDFKPGSPTPFELGLKGINSELDKLSTSGIPSISKGVAFSTGGADNGAASEMAGIRNEIRFLVRTLPRAIANANA